MLIQKEMLQSNKLPDNRKTTANIKSKEKSQNLKWKKIPPNT